MTENQRLKIIQEKLNFKSQAEFSKALGIKQGSLSDIYREKKGVGVSDSIKMKLEKEYSINIEWLETGQGDMLKNGIQKQKNKGDNNTLNNINGKVKGNVTISHNELADFIGLHQQMSEIIKTTQKQLIERECNSSITSELINLLHTKDKQIAKKDEQIDKLLQILSNNENK